MLSLKLRPYQEECLQSIQDSYMLGINRQLIQLPTGSGKTVVFASLIKHMQRRTLVLAHTTELLEQANDKLTMICPELDVGTIKAGRKECNCSVVVSTIQSARQPEMLQKLKEQAFSLCVYDEAHRSASDSSRLVLSELGFFNTQEKLLTGFSATPFRNDSKGLGEVFEKVVYHKSIKDLIALGYLCQPVGIKIKTDLDLSTVKTEGGDFATQSLVSVMNTPEMIEVAVNSWVEKAQGRKTIAFGVTVNHAKNLSDAFKRIGISSDVIYGGMDQSERDRLLAMFKAGEINVLTNCNVLTEGFDSGDVSCVLIARPTQSKGLFIQMAGRGLRLWPNKRDSLILDFGSTTHSLCGLAVLDEDSNEEKGPKIKGKISEFAKELPEFLNKKLRAAIVEFDLLSEVFTWLKDGPSYSLKAINDDVLKIFPTSEGRFNVMFFNGNSSHTIAKDLSFEYAFSSAEMFAEENRQLFTISDLEAPWTKKPISDKQKGLFKSFGYSAGIEGLSRGQAALIIKSGALNKKAVRR